MARTATLKKSLALADNDANGKVINFWFSGQTETDDVIDSNYQVAGTTVVQTKRTTPAPAGSGWSIWLVGDADCVCTIDITVKELSVDGNVGTDAGTAVWTNKVMGNSEVYHESLGVLDRCYGVQVTVGEDNAGAAGNVSIEVVYETHD